MGKINKSDTTPEMEAKAEEYRLEMLKNKCQHFAVGTWIMMNNRRGEIMCRTARRAGGVSFLIHWEDGTSSIIKPHALNRRNK